MKAIVTVMVPRVPTEGFTAPVFLWVFGPFEDDELAQAFVEQDQDTFPFTQQGAIVNTYYITEVDEVAADVMPVLPPPRFVRRSYV
jgi:hypothetical protein